MKEKIHSHNPETIKTQDFDTTAMNGNSVAAPDNSINFSLQKKEYKATTTPVSQLYAGIGNGAPGIQSKSYSAPASGINFTIQKKENKTGLPDNLKSGIENLSGHAMNDVKVHYNSSQPAQLNAHAYAQGNQIHIAPGQEKHLAHEAWHVVQQKQGRVKPTKQLKSSVAINDDAGLEKEADVMGGKALQLQSETIHQKLHIHSRSNSLTHKPIQGQFIYANRKTMSEETKRRIIEKWQGSTHFNDFLKTATAEENIDFGLWFESHTPHESIVNDILELVKTDAEREEFTESSSSGTYHDDDSDQKEASSSSPVIITGSSSKKDKKTSSSREVENPHQEFMTTAKAGLELTFCNAESKKYLTNKGFPSDEKHAATTWWHKMLSAWTNGIQPPDEEDWEVDVTDAGPNKDFGGGTGDLNMCRVEYKNSDNEVVFWWQLSMDPGVIEIQTCPVTGSDMETGPISEIIQIIYARAKKANMIAGDGGGHINVDFVTGFGEDYSLIPKILRATDIVIRNLKHIRDEKYPRLVDIDNEKEDPFISTERVAMSADKKGNWVGDFPMHDKEKDYTDSWLTHVYKKGAKNKDTLKKFRDAHAQWLLLHPTNAQLLKSKDPSAKIIGKSDKEGLEQVIHYQAVNIDHLFEEVTKDSDPRRLEFRFFKAQASIQDIIDGIKLIAGIIAEAKKM